MKDAELRRALDDIRETLAGLASRVASLEARGTMAASAPAPAAVSAAATPVPAPSAGMTDDLVLVIGAAVAAFLGERAHVRQIRLISSSAWAQQGRVSVQASHRLAR